MVETAAINGEASSRLKKRETLRDNMPVLPQLQPAETMPGKVNHISS